MAGNCQIPCYACKCSCNPVGGGEHPICSKCKGCKDSDKHEPKWTV